MCNCGSTSVNTTGNTIINNTSSVLFGNNEICTTSGNLFPKYPLASVEPILPCGSTSILNSLNIFKLGANGFGVYNGTNLVSGINLSNFALNLKNYITYPISLAAGATYSAISPIGDLGLRQSLYQFDVTPITFDSSVTVSFEIYEGATLLTTITGLAGGSSSFSQFINWMSHSLNNDTVAKTIVYMESFSNTDLTFNIKSKNTKMYTFNLTITDTSGSNSIPTIVLQTNQRYASERYQLIIANVTYCTCAATKKIQYTTLSDFTANGVNSAWHEIGAFMVLTGGEDLLESDTNKIESIVFRNNTSADVSISLFLGT